MVMLLLVLLLVCCRITVKSLSERTDLQALAVEIVEKCKLIHPSKVNTQYTRHCMSKYTNTPPALQADSISLSAQSSAAVCCCICVCVCVVGARCADCCGPGPSAAAAAA